MDFGSVAPRIFLILCGSVIAGCSVADLGEGAAPGVRVPSVGIRYNSVGIIDKSLQDWDGPVFDPLWSSAASLGRKERHKHSKIAVESSDSRRAVTGTLEVWAVLRNRTDHALQIEGRTTFFDAAGIPVEKPTAWKRVLLPPQSFETYRDYSTQTDGVSYYYVEIREGR